MQVPLLSSKRVIFLFKFRTGYEVVLLIVSLAREQVMGNVLSVVKSDTAKLIEDFSFILYST